MYKNWLKIFIPLFLLNNLLYAQRPFSHITVDGGLSNSTVLSVCKDNQGFMWFGTRDGLNRFDGRTVKIYRNDPENPQSILSNEYIYDIKKDPSGNLWIGSQKGLNYLNIKTGAFEQISYATAGKKYPGTFAVLSICIAKDGKLWLGTNDGLSMLENSTSRTFHHYTVNDGLAAKDVYDVFEDRDGNIWAGTTGGLTCFSSSGTTNKYKTINHLNSAAIAPHHNFVRSVTQDRQGNIWAGTDKGGLFRINTATGEMINITTANSNLSNDNIRKIVPDKNGILYVGTQNGLNYFNPQTLKTEAVFQNNADQPNTINDNSIKTIYIDDKGSVWLGTNFGGVNVTHPDAMFFQVNNPGNYVRELQGRIISTIAKDRKNNMWVGTEGYGIFLSDPGNKQVRNFQYSASGNNTIHANTVKSIWIDKNNNAWLGLLENGLDLYNYNSGQFTHFLPQPENPNKLNEGYISSIAEDSTGKIWLGTASRGLNLLEPATGTFRHINETSSPQSISNNYIKDILQDSRGNIWVGTAKGLNLMRANGSGFELYLPGESGIGSSYINCIQEDRQGNVWIGTYSGGVSRYNVATNSFITYTTKDGLPGNNISAISFDRLNQVWISTDRGLAVMQKSGRHIKVFDMADGLPTNEFSIKSVLYDTATNMMYFGSYKGLVSFTPKPMSANTTAPKVVITSLKLFNKPVEPAGADKILTEDIAYTKSITLKADQNIFTLEFTGFNYAAPHKIKYAYRLKGFEKEWNYVSTPVATYTNLPPGTYTFLVKAANTDSGWSAEPVSLEIVVLPPLWKTWWAKLSYVLLLLTALYFLNKFLRKQEKLAADLRFEHLVNERQEEMYKSRLDFFTRISHEIRTPLSLIYAPLEKLINITKNDASIQQQLVRIKDQSNRLLKLITELLDFRKIEAGNLTLKFTKTDLVNYCRKLASAFESEAQAHHIAYTFSTDVEHLDVYIDKNQFEKVLFNTLSNAFKFTPKRGSIRFIIQDKGSEALIIVEDNGVGIPKEDQDQIFNNFYQAEHKQINTIGWGIGLALAKQIIDLHDGSISVSSRESDDPGTRFYITLKKGTAHLDPQQLAENDLAASIPETAAIPVAIADKDEVTDNTTTTAVPPRATILIIEDNTDLREFLSQSLQDYTIIEASNGAEGLAKAVDKMPDLIITDVSMPEMDGFEFCKKLRADIRLHHIPVIMLTAMDTPVHLIEGLESGATIYMSKPFSLQVLELNVKNQLAALNILKSKYVRELMLMPKEVLADDNPDQKFLNRLAELVEENIDEPDFNVGALITKIGMSQTVLYKKLKALTGLTITDFIKSVRLNRAAQLLKQGSMNVAEVAYSVGFSDRKYFSKEFKKHFGNAPTDYIKGFNNEKPAPSEPEN